MRELALFEDGESGLRLLGRIEDPDLIAEASRRIARVRRRELAALEPPVRLLPDLPEPRE